MQGLLRLYNKAPYPLRVLAASIRGYHLRGWRYGKETEVLVKEALVRDIWSAEQWQHWRTEVTASLLEHAATHVPYYRRYWQERRLKGDNSSWTALANWPILTKDALRSQPQNFIADNCNVRRMLKLSTSGTSGKPLTLWRSVEVSRYWYALFEARWRHWYGVSRWDRWAIFGGQLVTPFEQVTPPFWVWNAGLRQLYMSTFHISSSNAEAYIEAIRRHRIVYILGYPSSMYALAQYIVEQGLEAPPLKVVISNAEPLLPFQREVITKAFRCQVYNTYGMAEAVAAASECQHGTMHLWPEAGIVEVFDDDHDRPLPMGKTGRLICTGLINLDMPLIRYEVGDRGALSSASRCPCGRTLPQLAHIEGRTIDNVITKDGRRIFWLNPVFYGLPVKEAQIIQETLDLIEVKVVPDEGYDETSKKEIRTRLQQRLGDIQIVVKDVEYIPRGPNGKFRAVISKVAL